MKILTQAAAVLFVSVSLIANVSARDNSYTDTAKVIKSKPIYKTVQVAIPDRRCEKRRHRERHSYNDHDSYTPAIAGAVLGGVVGNQFGKGNGKKAMTIAGAILGGSIGNDLSNDRRDNRVVHHRHGKRHCESYTRYESRQEIVGYKVKYKYKGKTFKTRTDYDPGSYINVRVSVDPHVDQGHYSRASWNSYDYDNDHLRDYVDF